MNAHIHSKVVGSQDSRLVLSFIQKWSHPFFVKKFKWKWKKFIFIFSTLTASLIEIREVSDLDPPLPSWYLADIYIPGGGQYGQTEGDGGRHHEDGVKDWEHYQDLSGTPQSGQIEAKQTKWIFTWKWPSVPNCCFLIYKWKLKMEPSKTTNINSPLTLLMAVHCMAFHRSRNLNLHGMDSYLRRWKKPLTFWQ